MFKKSIRNFDNIQDAEIRKLIDKDFNDIHDELSISYYDFWKHGNSNPITINGKTYDVQNTLEDSKKLFDKLHGEIFIERDKKFKEEKLKAI